MEKKNLQPYIDVILSRFKPAPNATEATHKLSTEEIRDAIMALNPGAKVTTTDVYNAMYLAGFQFISPVGTQGISFRWILSEI